MASIRKNFPGNPSKRYVILERVSLALASIQAFCDQLFAAVDIHRPLVGGAILRRTRCATKPARPSAVSHILPVSEKLPVRTK